MSTHPATDVLPNKAQVAYSTLLVIVHFFALAVATWGWLDNYRFARALFACLTISIAVNVGARFTSPVSKGVLHDRFGLVAVLLASAIVGPLVNLEGHDPRPWIWLATCVQAARALWRAPPDASRLPARKLLLVLAALAACVFATPWVVRGPWIEHLFIDAAMVAAVVVVAARRTGWIGGALLGSAAGSMVLFVTDAAWAAYYGGGPMIVTDKAVALTAGAGALIGVFGRIDRRMLGLSPNPELRVADLDYKTSAAARRLTNTLYRRGALNLEQTPGGKSTATLDDTKAVPVLIESLTSRDLHIRFSAAEVLGRIGPPAAPAVGWLRRLVGSDPQPGDRPGEALARIGADGVEALIELLQCDDAATRTGAAQALRLAGQHSAPAAQALAGALDDPDSAVRQHAAASLGELGLSTAAVTTALSKALADTMLSVRYAARKALGKLSR